jgi:deoxyribodipyrimidine photo-lyase
LKESLSLFWFRRDLRLDDNAGLFYALKEQKNVLPIFIFDRGILDVLPSKKDARVCFIHERISELKNEFKKAGSDLLVLYGWPEKIFGQLMDQYSLTAVYCNHDYEPEAIARDLKIKNLLESKKIKFASYKDQVIFEKSEVTKDDGKPYTVYTPYMKKWKSKLSDFYLKKYPVEQYQKNLSLGLRGEMPSLDAMGFEPSEISIPPAIIPEKIISEYTANRDFPGISGTSRLSAHLRFGTISIRKLVQCAKKLNETWLNELIWREFYMMILYHFPHVTSKAFKPDYDKIKWSDNEEHFRKWCMGETGYPIVDAGMRELNATGFMHNRVRMITASFLTKHLLIDWRWGEAYFAKKLLDFELSSNNGGWQWSASSGCDAAPYFRIFNPWEQTKKFDPGLKYIRQWIPAYDELTYTKPIVDHKWARERVLKVYKAALEKRD